MRNTGIALYLFFMNIVTFLMYGLDKQKAKRDRWRIPEATLLLWAALGGSIGAAAGMLVFHHKTKKSKFYLGIPAILLLQIVLLIAAGNYFVRG